MKFKFILSTTLIALSTTLFSSALSVNVDGSPLQMDVAPKNINGRTFVPVSSVAVATGANVEWDGPNKTVIIKKGSDELLLKIGSTQATKNGISVMLDAPAQISDKRTLVPLSFIAKNLDIPVVYDSATKTVLITTDGSTPIAPAIQLYLVTKVIDGDTIEVEIDGIKEKLRLIGVDTPESVHPDATKNIPFGKVATEFTKSSLEGKQVTLEYDVSPRDKYGRVLAYVYLDGKMFNKTLVENGMAMAKTYPPDVKYSGEFALLQEQARNNHLGMWENYEQMFDKAPSSSLNITSKPTTPAPSTTVDSNKNGTWIKGNKNSMIFHVPGGRDYNKVSAKNIVWFETVAQAKAAGYRQAQQ